MGMYDTIYIADLVLKQINKNFPDDPLPSDVDWQTKGLECCMDAYYLKPWSESRTDFGAGLTPKLYLLDRPEKNSKFWVPYTDEEIAEYNSEPNKFLFVKKEKGDGYFLHGAWDVNNRNHRDMGELPHQILTIYDIKDGVWFELDLKFTDGFLRKIKRRFSLPGMTMTKETEWLDYE